MLLGPTISFNNMTKTQLGEELLNTVFLLKKFRFRNQKSDIQN